ncbi:MAG: alpha-L-rhamnosidase-related protein [Pirellulaceae bacterium]
MRYLSRHLIPRTCVGAVLWVAWATFASHMVASHTVASQAGEQAPATYRSQFMEVAVSLEQPALTSLSIDALGQAKFTQNAVRPPKPGGQADVAVNALPDGLDVEYRGTGTGASVEPSWRITATDRTIRLTSRWSEADPPKPIVLEFEPSRCHATLLGTSRDDGSINLPAILHLPDQGSMRIRTDGNANSSLPYDARRAEEGYIRISFPGATKDCPAVEYVWEIVVIHPRLEANEDDARFAGFRRNWLNTFQWNPRLRVLANHAASDTCAFCLYEYADIALHTPPLAENLTALDLVRQSLDRYLDGMPGYGLPGYVGFDIPGPPSQDPPYLDSYPSLLIAARDYVVGSKDQAWLATHYEGLQRWTEMLLAMDKNGNGLFEYPYSGNSGSWSGQAEKRPANWWDCIGFGHEDAYANALAYRALRGMQAMAGQLGKSADADRYAAAADRLRAAYVEAFFNPATGLLAGWRSADGQLHDYSFLFVNGIAICYDLVPGPMANAIMDRLLAKMREVGYTRFDLGLPGNLVTVPRKDYVHRDRRWGGGEREDNADGFQRYENGGATACFAYFTVAALYKLDRRQEADSILFPMLASIEQGGFSGRAASGMTYDWKAWDGTPWGYEGFLVDNYYVLLAVLTREQLDRTTSTLSP